VSETLGLRGSAAGGASMKWRNMTAMGVLLIGLTQMTGDLCGNRVLKGLGAATAMAPCPKVFSDIDGLEAFASSFEIIAEGDGSTSIPITPELYARLKGPYNRRNVYGAAIAAAPRLPEAIWQGVFGYAFNPGGPLRRELALPENTKRVYVSVRTNTHGHNERWLFPCTQK
jgi:hypothetical protein